MSLSNDVLAYSDVKSVLDTAIERGGGKYTLKSESKAYHWRARAYKYRKLLEDSLLYNNPYSEIVLTLEERTVVIQIRSVEGKFTTLDGKKAKVKSTELAQVEPAKDDDLLMEAKRLVKEKGHD